MPAATQMAVYQGKAYDDEALLQITLKME